MQIARVTMTCIDLNVTNRVMSNLNY